MNEQVLVKKRESVSSPPASSAQNYYKLIYQEREIKTKFQEDGQMLVKKRECVSSVHLPARLMAPSVRPSLSTSLFPSSPTFFL